MCVCVFAVVGARLTWLLDFFPTTRLDLYKKTHVNSVNVYRALTTTHYFPGPSWKLGLEPWGHHGPLSTEHVRST